jgi:Hemerythrin HHE cation binding domain
MTAATRHPQHRPMFQIDLPRAVVGFVGVHLGLRAEAAHVERLHDAGDLRGAQRRAHLLATVLHHHHRAEDTVLFPALTRRQPGAAVTTAELEGQHAELDVALAALRTDLTAAGDVRRLVERHLGLEERQVLPLWMASFTTAEHERFAASLRRSTPLRDAGLMIAWLLDTAPVGSFEVAWDQVPPALRAVHRVWWRRRYERRFGSLDERPPVAGLPGMPLTNPLLAAA